MENENVYCIDQIDSVEGDYKVSNSYEIDSKRGIYAAMKDKEYKHGYCQMMVCLDILDMTWQQVHMNNI